MAGSALLMIIFPFLGLDQSSTVYEVSKEHALGINEAVGVLRPSMFLNYDVLRSCPGLSSVQFLPLSIMSFAQMGTLLGLSVERKPFPRRLPEQDCGQSSANIQFDFGQRRESVTCSAP